jgi:hypothetical protein
MCFKHRQFPVSNVESVRNYLSTLTTSGECLSPSTEIKLSMNYLLMEANLKPWSKTFIAPGAKNIEIAPSLFNSLGCPKF